MTQHDRPAPPLPEEAASRWERHTRKCVVCAHPDRDLIEVNWRKPWFIAKTYGIENFRCISRHARAAGLYDQRRDLVRSSLEHLIEQASDTVADANSIVRAVQIYSHLDDRGRWFEPRRGLDITVTRIDQPAPQPSLPSQVQDANVITIPAPDGSAQPVVPAHSAPPPGDPAPPDRSAPIRPIPPEAEALS
jgi:hypothetical protein